MPKTRQLKQQKLISSQSGGWKSKIQMSAGLVSGEPSLPDLWMVPSFAVPFLCAHMSLASLHLLTRTYQMKTPPFSLHWTLILSLKSLSPSTITLGIKDPTHGVWVDMIQSITEVMRENIQTAQSNAWGIMDWPSIIINVFQKLGCLSWQQLAHAGPRVRPRTVVTPWWWLQL